MTPRNCHLPDLAIIWLTVKYHNLVTEKDSSWRAMSVIANLWCNLVQAIFLWQLAEVEPLLRKQLQSMKSDVWYSSVCTVCTATDSHKKKLLLRQHNVSMFWIEIRSSAFDTVVYVPLLTDTTSQPASCFTVLESLSQRLNVEGTAMLSFRCIFERAPLWEKLQKSMKSELWMSSVCTLH